MQQILFGDTAQSTSQVLEAALNEFDGEHVTLRQLIGHMGEQGLLLLCTLLCLPFLFPVSIPGVSTVFGAGIILISLAIVTNRIPWLPGFVADRQIATEKLKPTLERGVGAVKWLERFIRPRLHALTTGAVINRLNGLGIMLAGLLLMMPFGLVPFSNTLPAVAVLLFCAGIAQRDGLIVAGGYGMVAATILYFAILAYLAFAAGQSVFA